MGRIDAILVSICRRSEQCCECCRFMRRTPRHTPVCDALAAPSTIKALVMDGIGALKDKDKDKKFIEASIRTQFADSLDTDEAFRVGRD